MGKGEYDTAPETNAESDDDHPQGGAQLVPQPEAAEDQVIADTQREMMQKIEELQAQAEDYRDKYLRSVADFSNYRKRQDRERQQQNWRIHADVLRGLLDPLDDFQRALAHVPEEHADAGWVQGIILIEQKLKALLSLYNVTPMEAEGRPFDPNYHEAMLREFSSEYAEGTVSEEFEKGYMMDDQVLRIAVVKGSQGAQRAE